MPDPTTTTTSSFIKDDVLSGTMKDLTMITIYRSLVKGTPYFTDLWYDGSGIVVSKVLFEKYISDRISKWATSDATIGKYVGKAASLGAGYYTSSLLLKENTSLSSSLKDASMITLFNVVYDNIMAAAPTSDTK